MIANLDTQLSSFRAKVRKNPEKVKVTYSAGYSGGGGGGSFGAIEIALMLVFMTIVGVKNKSNN